MAIALKSNFWKLQKLYFSDEKFQIFWYLHIYFVQKRADMIAEKLIDGGRKMSNPSLNIVDLNTKHLRILWPEWPI